MKYFLILFYFLLTMLNANGQLLDSTSWYKSQIESAYNKGLIQPVYGYYFILTRSKMYTPDDMIAGMAAISIAQQLLSSSYYLTDELRPAKTGSLFNMLVAKDDRWLYVRGIYYQALSEKEKNPTLVHLYQDMAGQDITNYQRKYDRNEYLSVLPPKH